MFKYKINMIDGKSYIIESEINNSVEFINELFDVNQKPTPNINIVHYDLCDENERNTRIAIISNHVSSIEWS